MGWHHCFDGLIRSGLCSIPWFTAFLVELKTFNRFLRDHKVDVADALEVAGLVGAKGLFLAIAFVTFAEWRWRKLARVCSALQKVFDLFSNDRVRGVFLAYIGTCKESEYKWKKFAAWS